MKSFKQVVSKDPIKSMRSGSDFAIITAFRGGNSLTSNRSKNKILKKSLEKMNINNPTLLVGHWQESPDPSKNWSEYDSSELVDVIEESYFCVRPDSMELQEFMDNMKELMIEFSQDAIVYGHGVNGHILERSSNFPIGTLKVGSEDTIASSAQGYSVIKGTNKAFTFA
jgi:hypothetical protein